MTAMKYLANLTALWLITAMLLACGGKTMPPPTVRATSTLAPTATSRIPAPSPTITPSATATPFVQIEAAALRGVRLRLWHAWRGETFEQLVASFNAQNEYGIRVEAVYRGNYNDLYAQARAALAGGELPEIAVAYPYEILAWQEGGARLVNLTPYLDDPQWGSNATDFYLPFWQSKGARYDLAAQRTAQVLAYNLSWAHTLGFPHPPIKPQDFREQACAAGRANANDADPTNDGSGGWVASVTPTIMLSWIYAFEGEVVKSDGTGYRFDTPQSEAAFRFLASLKEEGCFWQPPGEGASDGFGEHTHAEAEFAARRALFIALPLEDIPRLARAMERAGNDDEWTVLAFPSNEQPVITTYGPSFTIFSSSAEKELAAWVFLRWLLLPQNQARWIKAEGTFPLRSTTMDYLNGYSKAHPQWLAAVALLEGAQTEPRLPSWKVVRWALGDAGTQLFRYYFDADRIPATLALLDATAEELNRQGP
jgi:ABC-type glycerol-3-phosphate transport system substrate-binding protein